MKWIYQWFTLAMWKALESMKDGKKVIVLWIIDQNYGRFVVVLDHFRNFKGILLIMEYTIENEEGILIQAKGNYCSKLKRGKLKTKKLLKITILGEQEHSVQSADRTKAVQVWSWGKMYYPKPEKWPQHVAIFENISRLYKSLESGNGTKISYGKWRLVKPKYLKNKK